MRSTMIATNVSPASGALSVLIACSIAAWRGGFEASNAFSLADGNFAARRDLMLKSSATNNVGACLPNGHFAVGRGAPLRLRKGGIHYLLSPCQARGVETTKMTSSVVHLTAMSTTPTNDDSDATAGDRSAIDVDTVDVETVDGPFTSDLFASTGCWGRKPLLVKSAFASVDTGETSRCCDNGNLPSWNDVAMLASDEDAESRLITHTPGDITSYELQLGPFFEEDVDSYLKDRQPEVHAEGSGNSVKWTLVVNDVDRFYPQLSDWIDEEFHFIPRWRRDDGQISLSHKGGGIGPHVDNYDVFLVQTQGSRTWEIGQRLVSVEEEMNNLVNSIDVRILRNWDEDVQRRLISAFVLEAGDMLYLPPRIAHCGTALTDDCMTLSVGCRAPSASDMVSRLAETMTEATTGFAVRRYTDEDLIDTLQKESHLASGSVVWNPGEISRDAKTRAKALVADAMSEILDDDDSWDEFFGLLVSQAKRARMNYPTPLQDSSEGSNEDDQWIESLGVWGDSKLAVQSVIGGRGSLYQAEGITFAYSVVAANNGTSQTRYRLFVNGEVWTLTGAYGLTSPHPISVIANQRRLSRESFFRTSCPEDRDGNEDVFSAEVVDLLESLLRRGYLYGSDE